MNAGPSGFRGAPVTKGLLLATVSTSVILQASKARRRPPLLISLFTRAFAFRNPGELLFGASLLYFYRLFERQWGSAKYGSFVATACGLAYALEAAVGAALALPAAQGPFPLIFANLAANFVVLVPPLHRFTVFGLKLTDKAFIYLASIQLLFSAPPATVLAGGCGLLAGLLYRLNFLRVQRLRLPAAVVELFSSTFGRVLAGPGQPQQVFVTPAAAQAQQAAAAAGGGFAPYAGRQGQAVQRSGGGAAVEPSPEAVQQLVAMGFDEQQARGALRQTGNSVEAALQYLL